MSAVNIYRCDLCGKEGRPQFWWDNGNGGAITICRDGINGAMRWENLCPACRSEICSAVDGVIDARNAKQ